MDFFNGRFQAFLGPPGAAGAPDDLEKVIIDFIDQSEHTLDIAVQEIDNPRIAAAIDRAARRTRPDTDRLIRVRLVPRATISRKKSLSTHPTRRSASTPTASTS